MQVIYMVITNSGDGSNEIRWVLNEKVIDRMEELADEGDDRYASGDGLQVKKLVFPDNFNLKSWMKTNSLYETTLNDL